MNDKIDSASDVDRLLTLKITGLIPKDLSFLKPDLKQLSIELEFPVCVLTIIGKHFQHVKVAIGTDMTLVHRDHAFCSHTILQDEVMVIEDATKDKRFKDNPYVVDGPAIRFYAGAPLRAENGQKLGALCVLDTKPRLISAEQRKRLTVISNIISSKLAGGERSGILSQMNVARLLELVKNEAASSSKARIIALVDALYVQYDQQFV